MNTSQSSSAGGTTTAQPLSETARQTAAQAGAAARETAQQAADSVTDYAAEKKSDAADRVQAYGNAIHESANSLEQQDPNIAWFTHRAADRLERVADYVRDRDFGTLKSDAENLARRHPVAFFGGMCVAGLILGSVLKATGRGLSASDDDKPSESGPLAASDLESSPEAAAAPAAQI